MAVVPIVNRTSASAPKDYTLPQSQEFILHAVTANFDGTGAGSSFLPAVQLLAPDGTVMWTAIDTSATVAAGGSADVSWFPGVKPAASLVTAVASWGTYFIDSVTVPAGGFSTSLWHFNAGTPQLTIPGIGTPTFLTRGVYTVSAWIQSTDTWATPSPGAARLTFGTPTSFEQRQTGGVSHDGVMRNFGIQLTAEADAGATVDIEFDNFDTISHAFFSNQVLVQRVFSF